METLKSLPVGSSNRQGARKMVLLVIIIASVSLAVYCIATQKELIGIALLGVAAYCDYRSKKS